MPHKWFFLWHFIKSICKILLSLFVIQNIMSYKPSTTTFLYYISHQYKTYVPPAPAPSPSPAPEPSPLVKKPIKIMTKHKTNSQNLSSEFTYKKYKTLFWNWHSQGSQFYPAFSIFTTPIIREPSFNVLHILNKSYKNIILFDKSIKIHHIFLCIFEPDGIIIMFNCPFNKIIIMKH